MVKANKDSPANLKKHAKKHEEIWKLLEDQRNGVNADNFLTESTFVPSEKKKNQQSVDQFTHGFNQQQFEDCLLNWIVTDE